MQAHARAVENTRAVSKITLNFFETLHMHASNLIQIVEESQYTNDQKLYELQKKFEVTESAFFFFAEFAQITISNFLILLCLLTFTRLLLFIGCRNVLHLKKNKCWRKWQKCLLALVLGRKNW